MGKTIKSLTMRDAFFTRLYELGRVDRSVMVIAADMGAPALDRFRVELPSQFLNVGIAEEAMVTIAVGLALAGKKVYTYAIMPFATLRCFEAIKVNVALMNVPVRIVGVGAGFSYDDSGPTHHSTEDLSVMRVLPNIHIYNPSDSQMAARCADFSYHLDQPCYIRLDRKVLPDLKTSAYDLSVGGRIIKPGKEGYLLATGNMVHHSLVVARSLSRKNIDAGVIDVFRIKPIETEWLRKAIQKAKWLVTMEEHLLSGGFGSALIEMLADEGMELKVKRFGIRDRYYYEYGGRSFIQKVCGLDPESMAKEIIKWLQK